MRRWTRGLLVSTLDAGFDGDRPLGVGPLAARKHQHEVPGFCVPKPQKQEPMIWCNMLRLGCSKCKGRARFSTKEKPSWACIISLVPSPHHRFIVILAAPDPNHRKLLCLKVVHEVVLTALNGVIAPRYPRIICSTYERQDEA